ncbi:integral peroxisomal membrane peroxin-domain-containing protein [Phlyctochytrium arcticum]|nr:integral peroxisomal membrane peroxin-domain-containing protein [Phlyctochytrium arcticum]
MVDDQYDHQFETATYNKPTYCDVCDKFLWGLVKQGIQCRHCGMNIHKKCSAQLSSHCPGESYSDRYSDYAQGTIYVDDDDDEDDDVTITHRRRKSDPAGSIRTPSIAPAKRGQSTHSMLNGKTNEGSEALGRPSTDGSGSIVQELMTSTALNHQAMERAQKEAHAPLNLFTTTPKNFTKFVSRLGPAVDFQDEIVEILTWQNPSKTGMIVMFYIFICLYPVLLIIAPQLLITYIIIANYYKKTAKQVDGGRYREQSKKNTTSNAQYLKNLTFIQNSMRMYCDGYEDVKNLAPNVDWSDEDATLKTLKNALLSIIPVLLIVRIVPLNYIMLVGGVGMFLYNTALFRAASTTLPPILVKRLQTKVGTLRQTMRAATRNSKKTNSVTVVLFENQRWWAGLGWIPHLLRSERSPWSDESGAMTCTPKELYQPGPDVLGNGDRNSSWKWADDKWQLDHNWAEVDEQGWRYSDHGWDNGRNRANMGSLTRRRVWRRTLLLVNTAPNSAHSTPPGSPASPTTIEPFEFPPASPVPSRSSSPMTLKSAVSPPI